MYIKNLTSGFQSDKINVETEKMPKDSSKILRQINFMIFRLNSLVI